MDRLIPISLCFAAFLALTNCASPEQLRAQDEAACSSYGFRPGTPDFAACLQRENLARANYQSPQVGVGVGFGFGSW